MIPQSPKPPYGVIATTVLVALLLTAIPLPAWANTWRPAWVAMVLYYWAMAMPRHVGIGAAFGVGMLLDILGDDYLGTNPAGLSVLAFMAIVQHRQVRILPWLHQSIAVGSAIMVCTLVQALLRWVAVGAAPGINDWAPVVSSMVLWPWLFIVLRDLRRRTQVVTG